MKLLIENLKEIETIGYKVPGYDISKMRDLTKKNPSWLHFGAGNLFRAFQAMLCQELLENGDIETGVVTCEGYDEEIVTDCFHKTEDLSIVVTLDPDGSCEKTVLTSVAETLSIAYDLDRVKEIFASNSLQMITFTITEKGYAMPGSKFIEILVSLLAHRFNTCNKPLALVSMDNCSQNGDKLKKVVLNVANRLKEEGKLNTNEYNYIEKLAYPISMIDKITPRPADIICDILKKDGLEGIEPFETSKGTFIAPYVNAERPRYLVIEDNFPNGRPPLEKAGVIFTDRETVNRAEMMKVCTCLNPPQTALAIFGMLFSYKYIYEMMKDKELLELIKTLCYKEGLPVVTDPKVINPDEFLTEVFDVRLPNPFIPDTPQRISTDTSQKISVRYGETINKYKRVYPDKVDKLNAIPLIIAGYLRYLIGVNDNGEAFSFSSDPRLDELRKKLEGVTLGNVDDASINKAKSIISDISLTGTDLFETELGNTTLSYWVEMMQGVGAIRKTLEKYV